MAHTVNYVFARSPAIRADSCGATMLLVTSPSIDIDTVRLLHALGVTGTIGRAAEISGMSQQAASARIRASESQLGLPLVIRSRAGSVLTEPARRIVELGTPVLAAERNFQSSVAALLSAVTPLTVAASQSISEAFMPRWIHASRTHGDAGNPQDVRLESGNSDWVVEQVVSGAAQLGFVEMPDVPGSVNSVVVGTDELVLVVPPLHPWAGQSGIAAETIARTPLVSRESGSGTRGTVDGAFAAVGLSPVAPAAQLSSTGAVRSAIVGGLGPGFISLSLVTRELATQSLVRVDTTLELSRPLAAIWSDVLTERSREFLEALAESTRRHGG